MLMSLLILLSVVFLCGKIKYYYSKLIYAYQNSLVSVIGVMLVDAVEWSTSYHLNWERI